MDARMVYDDQKHIIRFTITIERYGYCVKKSNKYNLQHKQKKKNEKNTNQHRRLGIRKYTKHQMKIAGRKCCNQSESFIDQFLLLSQHINFTHSNYIFVRNCTIKYEKKNNRATNSIITKPFLTYFQQQCIVITLHKNGLFSMNRIINILHKI